ncbi:tyrosine-type recombinase/integrase [Azospirillum melinis]|uniref:Tyrosine-type recombinase/integrase n=1 Tax=Azospirillum melinis TaxID=328839 RepID=A0ABX2KMZ4_9PROT|nr:tyrosine-type recombinase/integrase [Azospirillum melinis]MBP2310216.1 site-specific recombinase XerD [Azospirillum melinis]NUB02080.1 tyrosine-type recombinase/integrase [Azospirillum melinis]
MLPDRPLMAPDAAIPFALVPTLTPAEVARLRTAFAARAMAAPTRRALLGDARLFVAWCGQTGRPAMPASRETVAAFLAAAAVDGRSSATLRRYRSSLAWWHAAGGFANPCAGAAVAVPVLEPNLTDAAMAALHSFMAVAQRGYAKATLRATAADIRLFAGWCGQHGLSWLPAEPATVGHYIRELGSSRKPATIARYLASISLIHRAAGHADPCRHWSVTLERRGHARAVGSERRQAAALTDAMLAPILDRLNPAQPDRPKPLKPIDLRDRALLLVGRDTLARADELVALRWEDLHSVDLALNPDAQPGEATIRIRRSKTDQDGEGAEAWLSAEAVAALVAWRAVAPRWPAEPDGEGPRTRDGAFLFCHLSRSGAGERMSPAAVRRVVERRTGDANPLAVGFSGHSLRVGAAQDLLAAGVDLPGLMQAGRWSSPVMPARYTERLRATRGAVARVRREKEKG